MAKPPGLIKDLPKPPKIVPERGTSHVHRIGGPEKKSPASGSYTKD